MAASSYMPLTGYKNSGSDFSKPPLLDVIILHLYDGFFSFAVVRQIKHLFQKVLQYQPNIFINTNRLFFNFLRTDCLAVVNAGVD